MASLISTSLRYCYVDYSTGQYQRIVGNDWGGHGLSNLRFSKVLWCRLQYWTVSEVAMNDWSGHGLSDQHFSKVL